MAFFLPAMGGLSAPLIGGRAGQRQRLESESKTAYRRPEQREMNEASQLGYASALWLCWAFFNLIWYSCRKEIFGKQNDKYKQIRIGQHDRARFQGHDCPLPAQYCGAGKLYLGKLELWLLPISAIGHVFSDDRDGLNQPIYQA